MYQRKISTKRAASGIVLILVLAALFFLFKGKFDKPKESSNPPIVTSVSLSYPSGWREQPLSDFDKKVNIILRLKKVSPDASFIARTVFGDLEKGFDINSLSDQTAESLAKKIQNFELSGKSVSHIGPFDAVQVLYTQVGPKDNNSYENILIIIPTQNQTFYLTFRSLEGDFSKIKSDVETITNNFATYLTSNNLTK